MKNRWSDSIAENIEGLDLIVYASRIIGEEPELVLWGGGNSSIKVTAKDHINQECQVLWIKGSGADMKTITPKQFTPLRLDDLLLLFDREDIMDEEMVEYQNRCVMALDRPKPSIETLLHAFLPVPHVYHTHADSICALTNTRDSFKLIRRVYGNNVDIVPYVRPGFRLAKAVAEAYRRNTSLRAIILDKHGLVTWGRTAKEAYNETITMVTRAEQFIRQCVRNHAKSQVSASEKFSRSERLDRAAMLLPILRGAISKRRHMVLTYDDSGQILSFVNDPRARALSQVGPFTPDHMLHTKPKPLFLELPSSKNPHVIGQRVRKAVEDYKKAYDRYFEDYHPVSVTKLDPYPRIVLIPGFGMVTTGKDRRAARIAHDLYQHTMQVIRKAAAVNLYTSISPREMCDFEYWPMENYKLTLLPPEKPFARQIALITGAAGAIGSAIATRLVEEGAAVVLTDVNESTVRALSARLNQLSGEENTVAVVMDITNEADVARGFKKAVLAFGGLDLLISNAGIARSAPVDQISLQDWSDCFAVNATGHFLVCREAMRLFQHQGLGGNIVVVATKNVLAPGKDFGAYSASKAAQSQFARVLAIEGADCGVRVNMVNPDGVLEDSGIWSKDIRKRRAQAYGIRPEEIESFCIKRTLLKVKVSALDVAEAVLFLASERSSKTTGSMIPVDGGVREAFPR